MLLRLGLATVIVVGNTLMLHGETTLFAYILFLIAASRLYDPLSAAMTNMAELFNVDLQVDRLKAIQNYPEEKGEKNYHTNGYDITFDHVGSQKSCVFCPSCPGKKYRRTIPQKVSCADAFILLVARSFPLAGIRPQAAAFSFSGLSQGRRAR